MLRRGIAMMLDYKGTELNTMKLRYKVHHERLACAVTVLRPVKWVPVDSQWLAEKVADKLITGFVPETTVEILSVLSPHSLG